MRGILDTETFIRNKSGIHFETSYDEYRKYFYQQKEVKRC